jgi:hypothetical protein
VIHADADRDKVLFELDETNNDLNFVFTVPLPDLVVSDIWWSPAQPVEGQTVTLYAAFSSAGQGGTTGNFDVRFDLNGVLLDTVVINDDVPISDLNVAFANGDFSTFSLAGWLSSNGFSLASRDGGRDAYMTSTVSSATYTTQSANFIARGDVFAFSMYADFSSSSSYVALYTSSGTLIASQSVQYSRGASMFLTSLIMKVRRSMLPSEMPAAGR